MDGDEILGEARRLFGFDSLLPGQREAVEAVVAGRDALVVMATGAGKSAVYVLAGRLRRRPALVVSPLLALQRDQSGPLQKAGLDVVTLNSEVSSVDHAAGIDQIAAGRFDFAYLAPEQLASPEVVDALRSAGVGLLAIDEAHLVSEWGQDFRPDYLRIGAVADAIGRPPVLALTATAAPPVRADVIDRLGMRDPVVMVRGFTRPNISLGVHAYFPTDADKLETLRDDVLEAVHTSGRGIVYAATRAGVEGLARDWRDRGIEAVAYHAGLGRRKRLEIEGKFHADRLDVIVATVAFGMGIDQPDVRWVFHADLPPSIDAYYQEFGRAGRDGESARAVLYYRPEDVRLPRMYAARSGPSAKALRAASAALAAGTGSLEDLSRATGQRRAAVTRAVEALAGTGVLTLDATGRIEVHGDPARATEAAVEAVARRRQIERTRVDTVQAYAETPGCRWQFLLEYFGEASAGPCGHCDNDGAGAGEAPAGGPFQRGSRVSHTSFGEGTVLGYTGGEVLVSFDTAGYRRLGLDLVRDNDLLRPAS